MFVRFKLKEFFSMKWSSTTKIFGKTQFSLIPQIEIKQTRNLLFFKPNYPISSVNTLHRSNPNLRFFSTESSGNKKENLSFIERAKIHGANALLGYFTSTNGFDACIKGLKVDKIDKGQVICSLL